MTRMPPPSEPSQQARLVGVSIPIPAPHGPFLQAKRAEYADPMAATTIPHVTLLGPTEVDERSLRELADHLEAVARTFEPFVMTLHGTGTFRPRSRVVFVQVAEGAADCHELERAIRDSDQARCPAFPFYPHVTVAHNVPECYLDTARAELADYHVRFDVDAFCLYERDGSGVWQPLRFFTLGDAAGTRAG